MPTPDPHTQSEVSSHKLNPDPRPKSDCAVCTSALCDTSGCMAKEREALAEARRTTPPLPSDPVLRALTLAESALSTYQAVGTFTPGQPSGYILRELQQAITHLTTPRPTPGGEWKVRKSLDVFIVEKDKEDIWLRFEEDANFLVARLNAADAMEKENKRLRAALEDAAHALEVLDNLPIEHDQNGHAFKRISCRSITDVGSELVSVVNAANAALRGGA